MGVAWSYTCLKSMLGRGPPEFPQPDELIQEPVKAGFPVAGATHQRYSVWSRQSLNQQGALSGRCSERSLLQRNPPRGQVHADMPAMNDEPPLISPGAHLAEPLRAQPLHHQGGTDSNRHGAEEASDLPEEKTVCVLEPAAHSHWQTWVP